MDDLKSKNATPKYDERLYKTYILTEGTNQEPVTNVVLPDLENVIQAKDWVDQNHL